MEFKTVHQSLIEIFPQIDAHILRAVAIEHSKDADRAVEVVLSEIVPCLPIDLMKTDAKTQDNASITFSDEDAEHQTEDDQLRSRHSWSLPDPRTSSSGFMGLFVESESSSNAFNDESIFLGNISGKTAGLTLKGVVGGLDCPLFNQAESSSDVTVLRGKIASTRSVDANTQEHVSVAAQLDGCSITDCETSKCSASCGNSNVQTEAAFNKTVTTRSGQVCNTDVLDGIIAEAKSNKKILMILVEKVMNLMKEVEAQEKAAEQAKEEAARGGLDILSKVEELEQILAHAKEANDMHAAEMYGEKSILATEVKELHIRLLNLSEERDGSLSILKEMRKILEARLVAVEDMKKKVMQEKEEKEESAKKALAEQEAIMEKLVQESKILQKAAEDNSELFEVLIDRGRLVDSLQGEISVICQDVRLLKKKFDEHVPLGQWITSSQTRCRQASSGSSSLKNSSLDIVTVLPHQVPKVSD